MSWLSSILPTIGTLLGGPLGGAAVQAVGKVLNIEQPTTDKVKAALASNNLTQQQIAELERADIELQAKLAELGISAQKIAAEDRANARAMQVSTQSIVPHVLAILFVTFYLAIISMLLTGQMKLWENSTLTMLLGGVTSGVAMILGFYFGATHSQSTDKK